MTVHSYVAKVPVYEAAKWSADNAEIMEISEWLSTKHWPLLTLEETQVEPDSTRKQGHYIEEDGQLRIVWPEDTALIPVGHWIVLGRRYFDITPLDDETFNFTYDQYGA